MANTEKAGSEPTDGLEVFVPGGKARSEILFRIKEELSKESDRGCALVAAAYLENELASLLERFFIRQRVKAMKDLFDFNGPVGTFSSKIKMAYALGLISRETGHALDILRKIRNEFAHLHEPVTFESDAVKQRTIAMLGQTKGAWDSCRDQFIHKILLLAAAIHLNQAHASHRVIPPHEDVPIKGDLEEHQLEIAARRIMAITKPKIGYEQALELAKNFK